MAMKQRSIYIGFDQTEVAAFAVARHSMRRRLTQRIPIYGLHLDSLRRAGLYTRPHVWRSHNDRVVMWDTISDAPISTEHANARFLVPHLAVRGWALFTDGDMLFRDNLARLFDQLEDSKAAYCVKHNQVSQVTEKKDGQIQTNYSRKNWTSFIFFNCDHPANRALTVDMVNTLPGRDLHRLCWIDDDELIGTLDHSWNFLVGITDETVYPRVVHYTEGLPNLPGKHDLPYADEWRAELEHWTNANP